MTFAQVHYPFENRAWFEAHFPADFVVEYVGQTRGWFYTLHVLASALFGKPAFKNCIAHGILLGHDKQKLSKRLRNYPDPDEMLDRYGADAMRWAPSVLAGHARRGPRRRAKGHGRSSARRDQPALERLEVLRHVRQCRPVPGAGGAPTPLMCSTATSFPKQRCSSRT